MALIQFYFYPAANNNGFSWKTTWFSTHLTKHKNILWIWKTILLAALLTLFLPRPGTNPTQRDPDIQWFLRIERHDDQPGTNHHETEPAKTSSKSYRGYRHRWRPTPNGILQNTRPLRVVRTPLFAQNPLSSSAMCTKVVIPKLKNTPFNAAARLRWPPLHSAETDHQETGNVTISANTLDAVTLVYKLRTVDLSKVAKGQSLRFSMISDRKEHFVWVKMMEKETVSAGNLGKIECYKLYPYRLKPTNWERRGQKPGVALRRMPNASQAWWNSAYR